MGVADHQGQRATQPAAVARRSGRRGLRGWEPRVYIVAGLEWGHSGVSAATIEATGDGWNASMNDRIDALEP